MQMFTFKMFSATSRTAPAASLTETAACVTEEKKHRHIVSIKGGVLPRLADDVFSICRVFSGFLKTTTCSRALIV